MDLSPGMAKRARSSWPSALICVGDIEHLPFRDSVFHGVICAEVLQYFNGAKDALFEMTRVLKSGGVLVVLTLNGELLIRKIKKLLRKPRIRDYSMEEIRSLLSDLGMRIGLAGFLVMFPSFSIAISSKLAERFGNCFFILVIKPLGPGGSKRAL